MFVPAGLLAGLLAAPAAQAQQRFQPGYLVLERGDTVRGLLEAPTRSMATQGVYFRKSAATEPQFYPIKAVRSLRVVEGKTYVVRKMQPMMGHDTLRLFMEPLAQGRATLYRSSYNALANDPNAVFANQLSFAYYYIGQASTPGRPPYLLQSNTFRSDLRSLFSDCPSAPAVSGKFTEDNLTRLVQQYNACTTGLTR
ncbi:hypothetical protein [Hymenobacter cheonanensis]|uniref:hypothetical protein n=1 Tax=Hymenobacter sp. CA2-7 TaxID=3063993 RepID=UPI0027135142|nr:hypothetical protein [Hymenobacter sp. CA2-7]MDO7884097.1 hypothetical protein [Hymenobacter sp. CA2-7]